MASYLKALRAPAWILLAAGAWGQEYAISTVAGSGGSAGFSGDGGSAVGAQLSSPVSVAVDSSGNLYIADSTNHRVRKVSNGAITTVAGNGTGGYKGDNGAATSAELNAPAGVAVDGSGNLYIADTVNNVIRKVTNGTITTFAGNNSLGAGYNGDGGAATSAQLNTPVGVAVDGKGNVYIADAGNGVIREVSGGNISTVVYGMTHPEGVAVDASNPPNIYAADTLNSRIVKYSPPGVYTVIAGTGIGGFTGDNGPGENAELYDPTGVAVDAAGNVYISDTFNNRVRKLTPAGTITTIGGTGGLYFSGDGGPATKAGLFFPRGVAVDSTGNVYIADTANAAVRLLQGTLPGLSQGSVVNAASFAAKISPGALATVFGTNFAPGNAAAAGVPLPLSIEGVSVLVNGKAAPILYVTPGQVNFQVPWETAVGPATVTVSVNGGESNAVMVPVSAAAPGLFFLASGHAVVQNSDFTLNGPSNPAKAGSTIVAYLSGSGPVDTKQADGVPAPTNGFVKATSPSSATIGSETAAISFAGLAPGFVGLVQVNIVVPAELATGQYPLTVTIGGENSNSATINVTQ